MLDSNDLQAGPTYYTLRMLLGSLMRMEYLPLLETAPSVVVERIREQEPSISQLVLQECLDILLSDSQEEVMLHQWITHKCRKFIREHELDVIKWSFNKLI